ncbi:MAG TPA: hypothetical protein VMV08_10820 [Gaiellaceae bacterium]|nr:hypothetical protein [Gaiellaceae bacterium]
MPSGPEAVWHLAPTASIYLLADPDRAGKALLRLAVADLAGEVVALAGRGISFGAEPPGGPS